MNKQETEELRKAFKDYMISRAGKYWSEVILKEYKKDYRNIFKAGFKACIKYKTK